MQPFHELSEVATDWDSVDGIPPILERPLVEELKYLSEWFADRNQYSSVDTLHWSFPREGLWINIFNVSELVNRVVIDDEMAVELWQLRKIHFKNYFQTQRPDLFMFALREIAVAETHQLDGYGWHIHLLGKKGQRLGYRFLFDSNKTLLDLSWERHGGGSIDPDYGDPSVKTLRSSRSSLIHDACLKVVMRQKRLLQNQSNFDSWAPKFVRPSNNTYVAHPHVNTPTLWI